MFEPSGRTVRCAKCGHSWHQDPAVDSPKPVTVEAPAAASADAEPGPVESRGGEAAGSGSGAAFQGMAAAPAAGSRAPSAPSKRRSFGRYGPLAAVVLLGLALVAAAYQFRVDIVRVWPQSASLYGLVGMEINTRGLWFRDVTYEREFQDGMHILVLEGRIVNITGEPQSVPPVRVSLRDAEQRELYHWTFTVDEKRLDADASSPFVTRLSSPPLDARDVEIRFVQPGD
jgi:hypothetical protein